MAAVAVGVLVSGWAWPGHGGTVQAQGSTCASAPFSANTDAQAGVAFVDVGQANTASFVCINTPGFPGGTSGPLTANGTYGNGCYFVEGIGTSVAAVYWELPDVRPDCMAIANINVGTSGVTSPTTSPTAAPTATATRTSTPAGTAPAATPTRTSTAAPANPTAVATAVAPAPAPTQRPPAPPRTGTGEGPGDSNFPLIVIAGLGLLVISGATTLARKKF